MMDSDVTGYDSEQAVDLRRSGLRRSLSADTAARLRTAAKRPVFHTVAAADQVKLETVPAGRSDYFSIKGVLQERPLKEIGEQPAGSQRTGGRRRHPGVRHSHS